MRRKSERTKEKEKSSPEKKIEKNPRRSRRQSRKRKGSVSSPDRDESGAEENETSMRSSQEDTEEEQVANLEESSSQVGAVITADLANTSEVEEINLSALTRSRRSVKKHSSEQVTSGEDANPSTTSKADSSHENEWKEDNTFWEEAVSKPESPESKPKDKEVSSPVWKVKCSDIRGGEIQKLKLCIVRPQEPVEPAGRKKKRIHRSSTSQQKEKSDAEDNESSKGSQGEDEKLSSDEKSSSKHEADTQEEQQPTKVDKICFDESPEDEVVQINVSEAEAVTVESEADAPEAEKEDKEADVNEEDIKGNHADNDKSESNDEGKRNVKVTEEDLRENPSHASPSPASPSPASPSPASPSPARPSPARPSPASPSASAAIEPFEHQSPQSDALPASDWQGTKEQSEAERDEQLHKEEKIVEEISGKTSDEIQVNSSVIPCIESHTNDDSANENKDSSTTENLAEDNHDCVAENESKEELGQYHESPKSPKESLLAVEIKNSTADINVKVKRRSASSDDEKESHRNDDSKDSSPRFRQRRVERLRSKEKEISHDESDKRIVVNKGFNKNRRHLERKSRSPQRREKISLRRSFSGKSCESEQTKDLDYSQNKKEDHIKDKEKQENKENDVHKAESDTIGTLPGMLRKRRWGQSNSSRPSKKPVLSISTHSLKSLIPGAKPVPIGEVQLVQDEDPRREAEVWDEKHLERDKVKIEVKDEAVLDKPAPHVLPDASRISVAVTDNHQTKIVTRKISIVSDDARTLQRSPSPPRHKATNVLFITNLVRPFTVNQLKELLARTGKIVEGGFWIDKIKSKCYVEYEKDSEAKETRHALHGVRWPVSNPKTLSVDFGKKEDMEMAEAVAESDQIPRKTEPLKIERNVDWVVEQMREKEHEREVRDREKEKEARDRDRDRGRPREKPHHVPTEPPEHNKKMIVREWDLGKIGQISPAEREPRYEEKNRERERKIRKERTHRSRSVSPHETSARKVKKKEEDAPAKLLDDLFRKTKTTPCIYWLPLTAEQIVVKEEMRRKHMAENERRMAEMRKAERERERVRAQQRLQRRVGPDREKRRRHSGSGSPKK